MQLQKTLLPVAIIGGFSLVAMAVADIGPFSSARQVVSIQDAIGNSVISADNLESVKLLLLKSDGTDALTDGDADIVSVIHPFARITMGNSAIRDLKYQLEIDGVTGDREFPFRSPVGRDQIDLTRFQNGSEIRLQAVVYNTAGNTVIGRSNTVRIRVDTEGPILTRAGIGPEPNEVVLDFRDDDLGNQGTFTSDSTPGNVANYYQIREVNGDSDVPGINSASRDGRRITLKLESNIEQGLYEVVIGPGVTDRIRNPAGQRRSGEPRVAQKATFFVGSATTGPAIAFPEFTPRPPASQVAFNPGDRVETRVVRLYYNRDARRVAQIVNRNIRSYNQARVDARQVQAVGARSLSDVARATLDRREMEGIQAAEQLRRDERRVQATRADLIRLQQRRDRVLTIQRELTRLNPTSTSVSNLERVTITNALVTGATVSNASLKSADATGGAFNGQTRIFGDGADAGRIRKAELENGSIATGSTATISGGTIAPGFASQGSIKSGSIVSAEVISGTIFPSGEFTSGTLTDGSGLFDSVPQATITNATLRLATVSNVTLLARSADQGRIGALRAEAAGLGITGVSASDEKTLTALENDVTRARNAFNDAVNDRDDARQAVDTAKQQIARAESDSQIANRNQFEAEVAARTEDPDSYAPANIQSIDRVMQVSISVIGEGLIQLRGPIRGINEIRRMINQMDAPVGQVKVGVFTVQVNGEHGDEMDEVASDIEAHIDLSRTLTNRSLQLIRRAVTEEAALLVEQVDAQFPQHRQVDRDRKYVYAFFGRDFIDELLAMDSEFLRSENKLLSLHSMDTVSLSQAMFVLALAKNDVRQRILHRFDATAQHTLADEEFRFRRARNLWPKGLKECTKISRIFGYGPLKRYQRTTKDKLAEEAIDIRRKMSCLLGYEEPDKLLKTPDEKLMEAQLQFVCSKSAEWNRFDNFKGFFTSGMAASNTMNPLQREFIRLAQIFKSQLIAEMEVKQRVIERGLIQDGRSDADAIRERWGNEHQEAENELRIAIEGREREAASVNHTLRVTLFQAIMKVEREFEAIQEQIRELGWDRLLATVGPGAFKRQVVDNNGISVFVNAVSGEEYTVSFVPVSTNGSTHFCVKVPARFRHEWQVKFRSALKTAQSIEAQFDDKIRFTGVEKETLKTEIDFLRGVTQQIRTDVEAVKRRKKQPKLNQPCDVNDSSKSKEYDQRVPAWYHVTNEKSVEFDAVVPVVKILYYFALLNNRVKNEVAKIQADASAILELLQEEKIDTEAVGAKLASIRFRVETATKGTLYKDSVDALDQAEVSLTTLRNADLAVAMTQRVERVSRVELDHRKLLDFLTDEQEEKYIELVEGTRSHIANVDNYLKRLAIALEDDFKIQFYDPAFAGVRETGRREPVTLGQIERTTILTNNRQFAKVSPQATMEFDLPKRAPVIVEAMQGAKALMQDLGTTVNDPTFVGLTAALSGAPAVGGTGKGGLPGVQPVFPTLGTDSQPTYLSASSSDPGGAGRDKTNLEKLIPDPAIYKFQTGTGFEIRPVIQPDGHSIIYNFNYLYTTNVREPVDPNEKHLGRVKQHFINTEVQTTSFELREISRYQVALRASRTGRGVPLLEEIPVAGQLFQPAASDESSLQQNIILGQTTVYPTLFDLMGLRWSRHVADLNHVSLRDQEHVVRGRNRIISDAVFDRSAEHVDRVLDIERRDPDLLRRDLYRQQHRPSPYHPGGYIHPEVKRDPTGRNYYRGDARPEEIRHEPPFDEYRGGPVDYYQQGREQIGEPVPPGQMERIRQPAYDKPQSLFRSDGARSLPLPAPGVQKLERIRQMSYERSGGAERQTLQEPQWADDDEPAGTSQDQQRETWMQKVDRAFSR